MEPSRVVAVIWSLYWVPGCSGLVPTTGDDGGPRYVWMEHRVRLTVCDALDVCHATPDRRDACGTQQLGRPAGALAGHRR
ncbi:hypothetical protein GCM10028783_18910 [Modestobacter muralis]